MTRTFTVLLGELEIEADAEFNPGCPGDRETASTSDHWDLTGEYGVNGVNVSFAIKELDRAFNGKITQDFYEQVNEQ